MSLTRLARRVAYHFPSLALCSSPCGWPGISCFFRTMRPSRG
jgi:hypothetical protein